MIDKDQAERNACENVGLDILLCTFHSHKLWLEHLRPLSQSDQKIYWEILNSIERAQSISELEKYLTEFETLPPHEVKQYFLDKWLVGYWLFKWIDLGRPSDRLGLWNTNNYTEAQIRFMSHVLLQCRTANSLARYFLMIFKFYFPRVYT